jgi:hypothetical protein
MHPDTVSEVMDGMRFGQVGAPEEFVGWAIPFLLGKEMPVFRYECDN